MIYTVLGTGILSSIAGLCVGVVKDKKKNFTDEYKFFKEHYTIENLIKGIEIIPEENTSNRIPATFSGIGSLSVSILTYPMLNSQSYSFCIGAITAVNCYFGSLLGELTSKLNRYNQKLNGIDKMAIDGYLEEIKEYVLNKNTEQYEQVIFKLFNLGSVIIKIKENIWVYNEICERIRKTNSYIRRYKEFEEILDPDKEANSIHPLEFKPCKTDWLIINNNEVYVSEFVKHRLKIDDPIEVIPWNKTIEELIEISSNYGKKRNLVISNNLKCNLIKTKEKA